MDHDLETMDVMGAAFNVAEDYKGGAATLARDIGKNPTTFAHEVSETGSAKLGLRTAVKMSKRSRDLRILHAFARELGQRCEPLPEFFDGGHDECMSAMSLTSKEFSDLCMEISRALGDDGKINDNELSRIKREGGELLARLHGLLHAVTMRNLADSHSAADNLPPAAS